MKTGRPWWLRDRCLQSDPSHYESAHELFARIKPHPDDLRQLFWNRGTMFPASMGEEEMLEQAEVYLFGWNDVEWLEEATRKRLRWFYVRSVLLLVAIVALLSFLLIPYA